MCRKGSEPGTWGGGWVEFSQVNNFLMQVIYDYYKLSRR